MAAKNYQSTELYRQLKPIYDEQMERQIQLKQILFEKKNVFRVARQREACAWELLIGTCSAIILASAAQSSRNRYYAIPIVPIIMYAGYRFDSAFGNNLGQLRDTAADLLKSDAARAELRPVGSPITLAELDARRDAWKTKSLV